MDEFLDKIKAYLEEQFANDTDILKSKQPKIYPAYKESHEPSATQPEIQIQVLNWSEQVNYTTFCGKEAENIPLQFTAYSGNQKIDGTMRNAQESSKILAQKVVKYIYDLIYSEEWNEIQYGRHITSSLAMPMNEGGSVYMSAVRFDFIIEC